MSNSSIRHGGVICVQPRRPSEGILLQRGARRRSVGAEQTYKRELFAGGDSTCVPSTSAEIIGMPNNIEDVES